MNAPASIPQRPPFIIHALGRSRTAWLSEFLTYRRWLCLHEQAIYLRHPAELPILFSRPNVGYAETAASFGWPLIRHARPDIIQVVIDRDPDEAGAAMMASYDRHGLRYDPGKMGSIFDRGHRVLRKISALPDVLTLSYADLDTEAGCRAVFEHCLPYAWDRDWWLRMRDRRVEADVPAIVDYYWRNRDGVENFKRLCKVQMMHLARTGELQHAVH